MKFSLQVPFSVFEVQEIERGQGRSPTCELVEYNAWTPGTDAEDVREKLNCYLSQRESVENH